MEESHAPRQMGLFEAARTESGSIAPGKRQALIEALSAALLEVLKAVPQRPGTHAGGGAAPALLGRRSGQRVAPPAAGTPNA